MTLVLLFVYLDQLFDEAGTKLPNFGQKLSYFEKYRRDEVFEAKFPLLTCRFSFKKN